MGRFSHNRRRAQFGRRREPLPIEPRRRRIFAAMVLAAPLAGVLAAIVALYADSAVLGILVAAPIFLLLSILMLDPLRRAAG